MNGNHGLGIQQGVAPLLDVDDPCLIELGLGTHIVFCVFRFGKDKIQVGEDLEILLDIPAVLGSLDT